MSAQRSGFAMTQGQEEPDFFERHYLRGENPRGQSGFAGDERAWEAARRPIAAAIDRGGSFLDIGCANGHLLESIVDWADHRIEPYGLDFAPKLVELARRRLPQWADRVFLGEALSWDPPRRFTFVRTELCYVVAARERELVERLLDRVLIPGGLLIVCSYGNRRRRLAPSPVADKLRSWGYEPELELEDDTPAGSAAALELVALRAPLRPGVRGTLVVGSDGHR